MSLFKSLEWWSTSCGIEETFNPMNLCIEKLNEKRDIIIVASLEGFLRIFEPRQQTTGSSKDDSDLLLETLLTESILAIESGRFNKYVILLFINTNSTVF